MKYITSILRSRRRSAETGFNEGKSMQSLIRDKLLQSSIVDLDDEWKYSLIIMDTKPGYSHPAKWKVKLLIILQIKNLLIDLKKQFTRSSVSHV